MIHHQLVRLAFKGLINQYAIDVLDQPEKSFIDIGNASLTNRVLPDKTSIEYIDAAMFNPYPFSSEFEEDTELFVYGYWIFTEEETANKSEEDYPWEKPFSKINISYKNISLEGPPEEIVPRFFMELDYDA